MCRYAGSNYKTHWACAPCRYTTKKRQRHYDTVPIPACPVCRAPMVDLGHDFHAPRRADTRQWRKVQLLVLAGVRFDSCGCTGPGPRPRTLSDARSQLAHRRSRHTAGTRREVAMTAAPET